jgi:hypothetical protein
MSNAVFSIAYADSPPVYPAGTTVAAVVVSISDTSVTPPVSTSQSVAPGTAAVTFANVDAGSYTYSVQAMDATSAPLGTAVTGTVSITAPATISISLPASATVTQA